MTNDWPTVRLDLDSRPETLTLVRGALGGVADQLALDPELLDDLKTAVSEACNNVVMHAYDDEPGPLDVLLYARQDAIEVVIRDEGSGIDAVPAADDRLQGVGLPVIRALTQHSEFRSRPEGGTEVRMVFAGEREGKRLFRKPARATPEEQWTDQLSGDAVVSLSPVSFVGGVLGRLARALAAKARFSLDRFSDVYLVTDAIAAHAARAALGERIAFSMSTEVRRLELTIGPFRDGTGSWLSENEGSQDVGGALSMLSDEVEVRPVADGEMLHVVMVDHRPVGRSLSG
ncbi:MAG: ATP-binding protein [Solirubrobacteraceae bacterium]